MKTPTPGKCRVCGEERTFLPNRFRLDSSHDVCEIRALAPIALDILGTYEGEVLFRCLIPKAAT